ncbi:MAG: ribosome assembly cofactor RimP, partial [Polaribacter sp.]
MNQAALKDIVDEALALNESLYLIELSISVNNKVQVVVDGDNGVSLSETMRISRVINDTFDREVEDFSLEV